MQAFSEHPPGEPQSDSIECLLHERVRCGQSCFSQSRGKQDRSNPSRAQIFSTDNFLPLCPVLCDFFFYDEKKMYMFPVMLFSMLCCSISQSDNSVLARQRIVSCPIVCQCFLSTHLLGPSLYPMAAFLWILLDAVTMVMGPYLIIFALPVSI